MTYNVALWSNGVREKTTVNIPLGYCAKSTDFDTTSLNTPLTLMCFNDTDVANLKIGGDYFGGDFSSLKIAVFSCVPSPTQQCDDKTTVDSYFS